MALGIFLILLGVLILAYPQILVAMIAGCFLLAGVTLVGIAWQFRRLKRHAQSRWMDWVIRY